VVVVVVGALVVPEAVVGGLVPGLVGAVVTTVAGVGRGVCSDRVVGKGVTVGRGVTKMEAEK